MMIAKGIDVFDLAISKDEAMRRKLLDDAIQASDLKKEQENLDNNGLSNEELLAKLNELKEKMRNEVNNMVLNELFQLISKSYEKFVTELTSKGNPDEIERIQKVAEEHQKMVDAKNAAANK